MPNNINHNNKSYTVSVMDNEFEITMYGEIVQTQPTDWWTGEPIAGNFIIQDEFLNDINTIVSSGAKKIKIRMNSVGGDCAVSLLIHNRLRELANSMEISCIVDGVAMSGGSLIMCACDNVSVNPASLIMIHKAWGRFYGGYNADELRSKATELDAWDKAQIEVYKRKTNLSDTVISHMMSSTTFMTGSEAVEKGFADKIIEDAEPLNIAASANRTSLYVNGRELPMTGINIPESIPTVTASSEEVINIQPESTGYKGGNTMARNFEELRAENPELAAQIESDFKVNSSAEITDAASAAAEAERNRLSAIDEIASLYDEETVRRAKYEQPCTAQEMAFRAAVAAKKSGSAFMQNLEKDYASSGAGGVSSIPGEDDITASSKDKSPEACMAEARANVKSLLHPETK